MIYKEYLKSPHWQCFRQEVLSFWSNRCALCNSCSSSLDVHHRHYNSLGKEKLTDCLPLCRSCHEKHHRSLYKARCEDDPELQRLAELETRLRYKYRDLKRVKTYMMDVNQFVKHSNDLGDIKEEITYIGWAREAREEELVEKLDETASWCTKCTQSVRPMYTELKFK